MIEETEAANRELRVTNEELQESPEVDHALPLEGMGAKLSRLVAEQAGPAVPVPLDLLLELKIVEQAMSDIENVKMIGTQVPMPCLECGARTSGGCS